MHAQMPAYWYKLNFPLVTAHMMCQASRASAESIKLGFLIFHFAHGSIAKKDIFLAVFYLPLSSALLD